MMPKLAVPRGARRAAGVAVGLVLALTTVGLAVATINATPAPSIDTQSPNPVLAGSTANYTLDFTTSNNDATHHKSYLVDNLNAGGAWGVDLGGGDCITNVGNGNQSIDFHLDTDGFWTGEGSYSIQVRLTEYDSASGCSGSHRHLDVSGTLRVVEHALYVVPDGKALTYGAAVPTYTFTLHRDAANGTPVTQGSLTAYTAPVCTSTYTSSTPVSSSPLTISCSGGSANGYAFVTTSTAQLTIGKATLWVVPNGQNVTYGDPAPASYGFKLGLGSAGGTEVLPASIAGYVAPVCTSTYSSSTPVSSSPLTISCLGGSADNYTFNRSSTAQLTIGKATLWVVPNGQNVTYGDPAPASYGFKLGLGSAGGTEVLPASIAGYVAPVCTSTYSSSTPVSSSPLTISCLGGSSTNYTFNRSSTAQLTIGKATLWVVPNGQNVTYGDPAPAYTFTIRSGSAGGTEVLPASIAGYVAPVCTSGYTSTTPASSSPLISCSGGSSTNYNFNITTTANVSIGKATLWVVPNGQNVTYGDPAPVYTFELRLGSAGGAEVVPASIAGYAAPVCTSTYGSSTPVSSSPLTISCSGGSADNYMFNTATTAQLTIGQATLWVVPNAQNVTYGDPAPVYTFELRLGSAGGAEVLPASIAGYVAPVCTSSYTSATLVLLSGLPITCTGGSADNYTFNTTSTAPVTIARATPDCTVTGYSVTYDGDAHMATGSCTGVFSRVTRRPQSGRHSAHQCRRLFHRRVDLQRDPGQLRERQRHGP